MGNKEADAKRGAAWEAEAKRGTPSAANTKRGGSEADAQRGNLQRGDATAPPASLRVGLL